MYCEFAGIMHLACLVAVSAIQSLISLMRRPGGPGDRDKARSGGDKRGVINSKDCNTGETLQPVRHHFPGVFSVAHIHDASRAPFLTGPK